MDFFFGDMLVAGTVKADAVKVLTSTLGDTQFDAAVPLTTDKQFHRIQKLYKQRHGTVVVPKRRTLYKSRWGGELFSVFAGTVVKCTGSDTITVDVLYNNVSVLTTPIVLDSANTNFVPEAGVLTSNPDPFEYERGKIFEVVVTTSGGGSVGQGLFVGIRATENPYD